MITEFSGRSALRRAVSSGAQASGAILLGVLLTGCGHTKPPTVVDGGLVVDGGVWDGGGELLRQPGLAGVHLATCDDPACGNGVNPPLGGDHCGVWLACRAYDVAQKRCNWIHNLEHGHAVLAYNCPNGCPEIVSQLNAIWTARQSDAVKRRILVTPDPMLPHKVTVIVWGYGWQGEDVNEAAINEVLSHQDREAPEAGLGCAQ